MKHMLKTFLASIAVFTALPLFASSFHAEPIADAVQATDAIVRGKVIRSESRWDTLSDGSRHLFTYYELEVSDAFKGRESGQGVIQFRELGGDKDGYSMKVSGAAGFSTGEEVVLMLSSIEGGSSDSYALRGMMMGKFNIERDEAGREYLSGPGIGSEVHPNERHSHEASRMALDEFREIIRTQSTVSARPTPTPSLSNGSESPPFEGLKAPDPVENPKERLELETKEGERRFQPLILLLGALIGAGMWFLKSRKNKR